MGVVMLILEACVCQSRLEDRKEFWTCKFCLVKQEECRAGGIAPEFDIFLVCSDGTVPLMFRVEDKRSSRMVGMFVG